MSATSDETVTVACLRGKFAARQRSTNLGPEVRCPVAQPGDRVAQRHGGLEVLVGDGLRQSRLKLFDGVHERAT